MTCANCQADNGQFHMLNPCCMSRHIKMQFIPSTMTHTQYAQQVAKRYGTTIEILLEHAQKQP
jgi:hypothetical protein